MFFAGLGVACAGAPQAPETPPEPTNTRSSGSAFRAAPQPLLTPAVSASAPPPLALAPASDPAPAAPALAPICRAKCERLLDKCSSAQVDSCRLNCSKYEPPLVGCVDQVRAALECARDARDLTCAHVAPESCGAKFRAIAACSNGEAMADTESAAQVLPDGWERFSDRARGFSIVMPRGSLEKVGSDGPLRSVIAPDGTTYSVSVLPLLKDKPSEKAFLHFLMKIQGRCSDKLKLDGFIEKAGRSSIHYTAHCPDKTDWDGMIYVDQRSLFLLSAQAPTGKVGTTEPFFYQFEFLER